MPNGERADRHGPLPDMEAGLAAVAGLVRSAAAVSGLLGAAAAHHLHGGSAWRARLALDGAAALRVPLDLAVRLAAACELVHQASIVHDDVQDGGRVRRGRASAAARFGEPAAICLGDHLLVASFKLLAELPGTRGLIAHFASRVGEVIAGQAEEFSPDLWRTMTPGRYAVLAEAKAGAMVALPLEGAALLAGLLAAEVEHAGFAARRLGMAYQAGDDIEDVAADLARGASNGVAAYALCAVGAEERTELLVLLGRACRGSLPGPEAASRAARMGRAATSLAAWAGSCLAEAEAAMGGHALEDVFAEAAAPLMARLMLIRENADAA